MAGAISEEGWLGFNYKNPTFESNMEGAYQNGSLRYWVGNVGRDYRNNFNVENFTSYFEECVLKYACTPSLFVLDHASYHCAYHPETFFPAKAKKSELKAWLTENNISFSQDDLKEELKILALGHWKAPETLVEKWLKLIH